MAKIEKMLLNVYSRRRKMIDVSIGQRIRYLREKNNYSREFFAEKIQISSKFLYEIENGKKGFSVEILLRITRVLNISCDYILTGADKRNVPEEFLKEIHEISPLQRTYIQEILTLLYKICDENNYTN